MMSTNVLKSEAACGWEVGAQTVRQLKHVVNGTGGLGLGIQRVDKWLSE